MDSTNQPQDPDLTTLAPGAIPEVMLRFVQEASRAIRNLPGDTATLDAATRACVPRLADVAVAVLADGAGPPHLAIEDVDSRRQPTVRGVVRKHGEALLQLAQRLESRRPPGRPLWLPVVDDRLIQRAVGDSVLPLVLDTLGVHSLILLPLRANGRQLGMLALARIDDARPYSAAELAGATLFARRSALSVVEARLGQAPRQDEPGHAPLRAAATKWSGVFEQAPWGAAVFDPHDLRIEAVNPALAELFGLAERETLLGQPVTVLLPEAERAAFSARVADSPNETQALDTVLRRPDGTTFPGLVRVAPLPHKPGAPAFRMLNVQDLTELKRTYDRLLQAQRMEAVGRLAGGIAHEVNNMMTIIMGFSDLLLGAQDLSPQERGDVVEIQKAARRAGGITQQLLAFSRQQILMPAVLDLNEVIEAMTILLRPLLPANVHLEVRPAKGPVRVRADRAQVEQILINLAFNARDALPRGGRIELRTAHRTLDAELGRRQIGIDIPPGSYAVLEIADSGVGMDEPTRRRVFEPFFTTKPAGQGTGLGLATVYGIVKQSGGFVWVDSAPDRGTTFTIAFPEAGESTAVPTAQTAVAPRASGTGTVLVVEDEPGVRDLAIRLLRHDGHEVYEASHGWEALAVLAARGPTVDLVIADVVMPDMGGADLSQRLEELGLDIPILYMSGYTRDEVLDRHLIQRDAAFLQKPFTAEELASAVNDLLARPEAQAAPGERQG